VKRLVVAPRTDAVVSEDIGAIVFIFQNDVDYSGHSIVAIDGARAILQDFNPVNGGERNRV